MLSDNLGSDSISTVSSQPSYSSADIMTTGGFLPLGVMIN